MDNLPQRAEALWPNNPIMQQRWIEAVHKVRLSPGWRNDPTNQPPNKVKELGTHESSLA